MIPRAVPPGRRHGSIERPVPPVGAGRSRCRTTAYGAVRVTASEKLTLVVPETVHV